MLLVNFQAGVAAFRSMISAVAVGGSEPPTTSDFARGIHHCGTVIAKPTEVQYRNVASMRLFRLYLDSGSGGLVRR